MENELALRDTGEVAARSVNEIMVQTREMTEIQAMVISAKRFPRDLSQVRSDVLASCDSPALAEVSQYAYTKGNTEVTGISIRLAEELAGCFNNLDKGWIELERKRGTGSQPGESVVQAYCWDMQRNVKAKRTFTVRHFRDTKKGGYILNDEREIYELLANQAARRLRACILEIIPKFIQEEALGRCEETLKKSTGPIADKIKAMVEAFAKLDVTKEMIEKRFGHSVESTSETEYLSMKKIYNSICDKYATTAEFFSDKKEETNAPVDSKPAPEAQTIKKPKKEAPKNHATPEAIAEAAAKKDNPVKPVEGSKDAFPVLDTAAPPALAIVENGGPTFKEVWEDCAKCCKALGFSPVRLSEFTKEKWKKSPADLQRANDVKTLLEVYETLLAMAPQAERD